MLDANNQEVPGSENPSLIPPSSMLEKVSNGFYTYTDAAGEVHQVPVRRTTEPVLPRGVPTGSPTHVPTGATPPAANGGNSGHPAAPHVDTATTHSDVIGHKGIPKAKIEALDKDTNKEYARSQELYDSDIAASEDPKLKLNDEQKKVAKQQAFDKIKKRNDAIAAEHSQRMRDLGLIPAEDSAKQAQQQPAEAPKAPAPTAGPKVRTVYQHGRAVATGPMTDEEVKTLENDPDFKAQGGSIK